MRNFDNTKREPLMQESAYRTSVKLKQGNYVEVDVIRYLAKKSKDYEKQRSISWSWVFSHLELLIQRYSGGEPIEDLGPFAEQVFAQFARHQQSFPDFCLQPQEPDAYQYILWLLALATLFDMPERIAHITSWISCAPNGTQDALLSRLLARVGAPLKAGEILHKRPYSELFNVLNSTGPEQQLHMSRYLKQWYSCLRRCYWHGRDKRPASGFFGYWAFEAGMVTLLWNIDDTPYRELPYYPKDLVDHARANHGATPQP